MENTTTEHTEAATPAETNTPTATATPAAPAVNENDPDFEFLGLRREHWGPLYEAAYQAEKQAVNAAAEVEAAEVRLREGRERLARIAATEFDADEDAKVAAAQAVEAREKIDRATSRKEREECRAAAAEAEEKANAAADHASHVKSEVIASRGNVGMLESALKPCRERARRLRETADADAQRAIENELPRIQERLERAEEIRRKRREAEALCAARRHLVRVPCRDCRNWEPFGRDPSQGKCHARPPVADSQGSYCPTTSASDWCALGETIPAAAETVEAAPGDAAAETPAETASGND